MPSITGSVLKTENEAALDLDEAKFTQSALKKPAWKTVLATFESIVLFAIFAFLQYGELFYNIPLPHIRLDYCIIYIIIIGILWGQLQAYFAMFLSTALFVGVSIYSGVDIITFIYTPENLIQIAVYLLVGIITGYTIERKNRDIESKDLSFQALTDKYNFLLKIYSQTKLVKKELESQIIDTEDSFSTIYSIIQEVDRLEIEKVFSGAITAIERIMKTNQVSIYTLSAKNAENNKDGSNYGNSTGGYFKDTGINGCENINQCSDFMRLKARSIELAERIPNSIRISDFPQIEKVISTRCVYANKKFDKDLPVMIAPVLEEKKVIAIISIHEVEFENLTAYYENLFTTVVGLIANAVKRAYFFENSLKHKRYIPDTAILVPDVFEKVLDEIKNNKIELGMSYSLLKIISEDKTYPQVSQTISSDIRDNDYIGLSHDESLYVLLSNTRNNYAGLVMERLKKKSIESELVMEESIDE